MSFPFQRSDTKKDVEEVIAREGDPLLPGGIRGGRQDPSSSLFEERPERGGLRARRSSRSTESLQQEAAPTILSTTNSNSLPTISIRASTTTALLQQIDSQMNQDDEAGSIASNTDAATNNMTQDDDNSSDAVYVNVGDHESLTTSSLQQQTSRPLNSIVEPNDDHFTHHVHPSRVVNPHFNPPYQPPRFNALSHSHYENTTTTTTTFRPPSPDTQSHEVRSVGSGSQGQPPLLEIPEEIYAVRKAALKVLKPLTKTWIVISVGFSLTVLFGMARWTQLLPTLPYWFILLPCWLSHVGLLWLHILSAKALSTFIAEANDSRQRPDSRDHLNRTEYLPLLQRSLKFGLKTGILSFFIFLFEILVFIRFARGTISMTATLVPIWLLVAGGIFDGLVCKTQHLLRVLCWMLCFAAMILLVLKKDYGYDNIRWRIIMSPVIAILTLASGSLVYIVYGHQIGYYRLTEAQLTAGNLYALAALICIILFVIIGEVIPLSRPVEVETKIFVVVLAPLVVCLIGMGAWVVSRDEFSRLLLYGGQAAVHPKKLRWIPRDGWTCVQGKGVTVIPLFGEVNFRPLERKPPLRSLELSVCCSGQGCCYPYEDVEEEEAPHPASYHPYLESALSGGRDSRRTTSYNTLRGL